MPLQNQPALYTEGKVNLNPAPYVNIALQARARKQAREDALDKYYRALPDTLNDKGLRDQEVPVINDYKQKIFDFGQQNKEALRNPKIDNGAAQHNLDKLFREAQGVTRLSQNAAQRNLQRGRMWLKKENQFLLNNDDYMQALHYEDLPVTDPNYKELNDEQFLSQRPFDLKSKIKNYADIKMSDGAQEISAHPTDPLLEVVKNKPVFDEDAKKTIYARAVNDLHNDYSFEREIDNLTPTDVEELNKISQEQFGHPIREDFAKEDASAAYMIRALAPKPSTQKIRQNVGAIQKDKNAEWDRRNRITFKQSMAKIAANKQAGQVPEDTGYLSDNVADEAGENITVRMKDSENPKERTVIFVDKVDPSRLDIITGRDVSKKKPGVKPDAIKVLQPDGSYKVRMGYYLNPGTGDWEGADGQTISRERVKDDYVNKTSPTKFKAQSNTKASENTTGETKHKDLDPKAFTKEGKYWKYKDGRLFDDAGNEVKK